VQNTLHGYPQAIRAKEAAAILSCSVTHIYNLVKEGYLTRTRIGVRSYAYDPLEVLLLAVRGIPADCTALACIADHKRSLLERLGAKFAKLAISLSV